MRLLAAAAVALTLAAAASGATAPKHLVIAVAHGAVNATNAQYVDAAPAGPSVGDVRTYYLPLTKPGGIAQIGYFTGTLTTVAENRPAPGMELRTSNLLFVIGAIANQIVVGGVAGYSQVAPTVATKSVVVRPVIGGAGKYAGAHGWCVTAH